MSYMFKKPSFYYAVKLLELKKKMFTGIFYSWNTRLYCSRNTVKERIRHGMRLVGISVIRKFLSYYWIQINIISCCAFFLEVHNLLNFRLLILFHFSLSLKNENSNSVELSVYLYMYYLGRSSCGFLVQEFFRWTDLQLYKYFDCLDLFEETMNQMSRAYKIQNSWFVNTCE